jgi:hypothetical protein
MLKTLFTERWATFPYNVKVQTMFFLVQYLGLKGVALPPYVVLELCQVWARIVDSFVSLIQFFFSPSKGDRAHLEAGMV